ncbi:MAG: HIT family protein [Lachnospiraceae bacterium]|nr:HIT family protein [Lachnospiraceae bacterium]
MCVFCKIANKEQAVYTVYEADNVMAFLDYDPINEGHILLIPKKHYLDVDELPSKLLAELMETSQKLVKALKKVYNPEGYSIMQNGGKFNDVGHYHLHIFPRYTEDGFGWAASDMQFNYSQEVADKIAAMI